MARAIKQNLLRELWCPLVDVPKFFDGAGRREECTMNKNSPFSSVCRSMLYHYGKTKSLGAEWTIYRYICIIYRCLVCLMACWYLLGDMEVCFLKVLEKYSTWVYPRAMATSCTWFLSFTRSILARSILTMVI